MPAALLICQKSIFLDEIWEYTAAIAQAHPLPLSDVDQNVPQLKASRHQSISQYLRATSDVAKRFIETIVFMKTPSPIISDDKFPMADKCQKRLNEAQNGQRA